MQKRDLLCLGHAYQSDNLLSLHICDFVRCRRRRLRFLTIKFCMLERENSVHQILANVENFIKLMSLHEVRC
jgi:hypothetical protein